MKNLLVVGLMMLLFVNVYAQRGERVKNPYQTVGTKEYQDFTAKLIGQWTVASFSIGGDEQIGTVYEKAKVEFKEFDEKGVAATAVFRFTLKKDIVDSRFEEWNKRWNKKGEPVSIDSYDLISTVEYKIEKKGDIIYFDNQSNNVEIVGKGDPLESFQIKESAFIKTQSDMKNSGGVGNLVGAKLLKSVTGTNFVQRLPDQLNHKDLTDTSVELVSLSKRNFKLVK